MKDDDDEKKTEKNENMRRERQRIIGVGYDDRYKKTETRKWEKEAKPERIEMMTREEREKKGDIPMEKRHKLNLGKGKTKTKQKQQKMNKINNKEIRVVINN